MSAIETSAKVAMIMLCTCMVRMRRPRAWKDPTPEAELAAMSLATRQVAIPGIVVWEKLSGQKVGPVAHRAGSARPAAGSTPGWTWATTRQRSSPSSRYVAANAIEFWLHVPFKSGVLWCLFTILHRGPSACRMRFFGKYSTSSELCYGSR